MDYVMPEIDGFEATKQIRALGYKGTIIALTADVLAGQTEMFTENGFDDIISKPVDIRQLDHVLNRYIREKHKNSV